MVERQEKREKNYGEVRSYFDVTTPQEFKENFFKKIKFVDEKERKFLAHILGLEDFRQLEDERSMEPVLDVRIAYYNEAVERIRNEQKEVLTRAEAWVAENNFMPPNDYWATPVLVSDKVLRWVDKAAYNPYSQFDYKENVIYFNAEHGKNVLAHEYWHAMTLNVQANEAGFSRILPEGGIKGNKWLDEGCAVMAEFGITQMDDTAQADRAEQDPIYVGYRWLAQRFAEKLGINETVLLKAALGQEPYRQELAKKTQEIFNCTIDDLDSLFFGSTDEVKEKMLKILNGDPVTLEVIEGTSLVEDYNKLKKIFGNIEVAVKPSRTKKDRKVGG